MRHEAGSVAGWPNYPNSAPYSKTLQSQLPHLLTTHKGKSVKRLQCALHGVCVCVGVCVCLRACGAPLARTSVRVPCAGRWLVGWLLVLEADCGDVAGEANVQLCLPTHSLWTRVDFKRTPCAGGVWVGVSLRLCASTTTGVGDAALGRNLQGRMIRLLRDKPKHN